MTNRITREPLEKMTKVLASALGKPYGHYKKTATGYDAIVGGLALSSYSPGDSRGTRYALTECTNEGGGSRIIGYVANTASEMDSALRLALDVLELALEK